MSGASACVARDGGFVRESESACVRACCVYTVGNPTAAASVNSVSELAFNLLQFEKNFD